MLLLPEYYCHTHPPPPPPPPPRYAETSFIAVQGMQSHTSTVVSNISRVNLNVLAAAVEDQKASLADDERTMLFRKASKLEQDLNEDVVTWPLLSAVLVAVVSMFLCGYVKRGRCCCCCY